MKPEVKVSEPQNSFEETSKPRISQERVGFTVTGSNHCTKEGKQLASCVVPL